MSRRAGVPVFPVNESPISVWSEMGKSRRVQWSRALISSAKRASSPGRCCRARLAPEPCDAGIRPHV